MLTRLTGLCFLIVFLAAPAFAFGDDAPAWLQQAAAMSVPAYEKDVPAVTLVDDRTVTVNEDGRVTRVYNYAVRILLREGRHYAVGRVGYVPDTSKVKELKAWLIRASGQVKRYGKDNTLDLAGAPNDVYNEYRIKGIYASDDAEAGAVFGYTYTVEDRSVFSQDEWAFQSSNPVISSRYTLVLPAGWRAEGVTFNHPRIEPKVNDSAYTWELANLPPVPIEPQSPSLSNLVARLAVSYYPASGAPAANIRTFANWSEVGAWLGDLEDPQVTLDDSLTAKARELTANAKTEYEKIQAIGRYVQSIQYISIQTGLGRGGGYRPHLSTEVFAKAYGDCKDKANLMRAMLKVVGIISYPVSIYSGDPDYVRPEWPSPQQFNHCIIAVKVSDETQAQTTIQHPRLGRLLIFDPTDGETTVGDLPFYLQGSLALIDSRDSDALVRMPTTPPEMNGLEGGAELQLGPDGSIAGTIQERAHGQTAARFRAELNHLSRPQYNTMIERWITSGAPGAKVSKIEPADSRAEGRFALEVAFSAQSYGQLMRSTLLVFKPAIVSRLEWLPLTDPKRKHPVVLRSNAYSETVHVKLPAGFDVDEMPDPVKIETPFGAYATSYEVKDGQLTFTRKLIEHAATIPPEQYASVRSFFERIRAAENSPVVLAKK